MENAKRLQQSKLAQYRADHTPDWCPILGIPLDPGDAVLDHDHRSGHVRGVIHRQANALMGKIENFHRTFLSRLGCEDLRPVLIAMVDWMDANHSHNPLHPSAIAKMVRNFRRKSASEQRAFLESVGVIPAKNSAGRTRQARAWLLSLEAYQDTTKRENANRRQFSKEL